MKFLLLVAVCCGLYWFLTNGDEHVQTEHVEVAFVDSIKVDTSKQQLKDDVKQLVSSTVDVAGDVVKIIKDNVK